MKDGARVTPLPARRPRTELDRSRDRDPRSLAITPTTARGLAEAGPYRSAEGPGHDVGMMEPQSPSAGSPRAIPHLDPDPAALVAEKDQHPSSSTCSRRPSLERSTAAASMSS